jgi:TolB-like protein
VETPFPAYRGDEPYIFVCYAHEDTAVVYPELQRLHDGGIRVYYDEGISPGHEWTQELADAIDGSSQFLYFVSPHSVASRHCRNEVQYALEQEKPVVSVYLEPTDLPGGLKLSLGSAQAILKHDLSTQDYLRKLSAAFGLGAIPPVTESDFRSAKRSLRLRWGGAVLFATLALVATLILLGSGREPDVRSVFDRSLAVETFSALSDDQAIVVLAEGVTDELLSELTDYYELRVVRTSENLEPGSGRRAQSPGYSVSGTLQSTDNSIVVRAELVRVRDKEIVWSESLERPIADFADGGVAVATLLSKVIRFELGNDHECQTIFDRSKSRHAAELVCNGFAEHFQATQGRGSDPHLVFANAQKAIKLDPKLVHGYQLLAIAYALLSSYGEMPWEQAYPKAKQALDKALVLDLDNAMTLYGLGITESLWSLNWRRADDYLSEAIKIDPLHPRAYEFHVARAYVAFARGEARLAIAHCERSIKLNSANGRAYLECARALNSVGQHTEAVKAARNGIELLPTGPWRALLTAELIFAASKVGDSDLMLRELGAAFAAMGPQYKMLLADSFAMAGEVGQAERLLSQLESATPDLPTFEVWANLELGRLDQAFSKMGRAIDRREGLFLTSLRAHPRYDPMRIDPRWGDVMEYLRRAETTESKEHSNSS